MPNGPTPNDAALADIYNLAGSMLSHYFEQVDF